MGRLVGIEPTRVGATIRCVNRFTKAAILKLKRIISKFCNSVNLFFGKQPFGLTATLLFAGSTKRKIVLCMVNPSALWAPPLKGEMPKAEGFQKILDKRPLKVHTTIMEVFAFMGCY